MGADLAGATSTACGLDTEELQGTTGVPLDTKSTQPDQLAPETLGMISVVHIWFPLLKYKGFPPSFASILIIAKGLSHCHLSPFY